MFLQLILVIVVLIPLLTIVLDSKVGQALASRLERRGVGGGSDISMERLAYLESEVERLSSEVARLDEESEFVHKLLTDKTGPEEAQPLPRGDEVGS